MRWEDVLVTYSGAKLHEVSSEDHIQKLISEVDMAKLKDIIVQVQVKYMLNNMYEKFSIDINIENNEIDGTVIAEMGRRFKEEGPLIVEHVLDVV